MPIYEYEARDKTGQLRRGTISAGDLADATKRLREQDLIPVRLTEQKPPSPLAFFRVPARPLAVFFRHLYNTYRSGIPLSESLQLFAETDALLSNQLQPLQRKGLLRAFRFLKRCVSRVTTSRCSFCPFWRAANGVVGLNRFSGIWQSTLSVKRSLSRTSSGARFSPKPTWLCNFGDAFGLGHRYLNRSSQPCGHDDSKHPETLGGSHRLVATLANFVNDERDGEIH